MGLQDDIYGRRALDFVERVKPPADREAICRATMKELEWFGLSFVTAWTMPRPDQQPDEAVILNNRPRDYIEHYKAKNYLMHDPVVTELRTTVRPYTWSDIRKRRKLTRSESRIMDEGLDFGVDDGIVIPIVTLSGALSVFSPCGAKPDLSERARAVLDIIGVYAMQMIDQATALPGRDRAPAVRLTAREREVMRWVAVGKSDEEIAGILSLRKPTVTWHVENAKRKLDALRRPHAVAQAIRLGEIDL